MEDLSLPNLHLPSATIRFPTLISLVLFALSCEKLILSAKMHGCLSPSLWSLLVSVVSFDIAFSWTSKESA